MEEEHCLNNWDLDAVVRLACRRLSPPPLRVNDTFDSLPPPPSQLGRPPAAAPEPANKHEAGVGWRFPGLRATGGGRDDGDELLRALLAVQNPVPPQQQPVVVTPAEEVPAEARRAAPASSAPTRAQPNPSGRQVPGAAAVPRSKRRKNQVKKVVCRVPADGSSSSDVWAWRKYGQKPIKGSPYPRGYYRCSSSKGCAARKQVERCRTDPNTFSLTFTGDHNHAAPTHRNSLAGTTRHKFPSASSPPPSVVVVAGSGAEPHLQPSPSAPSTSSTSSAPGLSPTTPLRTPSMEEEEYEDENDEEEDEEELMVEDMEMAGEDELLFLNGGDADPAAPLETMMPSLFDVAVVDESFLGSPASSGAAGAAWS